MVAFFTCTIVGTASPLGAAEVLELVGVLDILTKVKEDAMGDGCPGAAKFLPPSLSNSPCLEGSGVARAVLLTKD